MIQFILKVVVPNYWAGTQYRLWIICYWVAETEENVLFFECFHIQLSASTCTSSSSQHLIQLQFFFQTNVNLSPWWLGTTAV